MRHAGRTTLFIIALVSIYMLLSPTAAFSQDEPRTLNIPNPMGAHTWFIIAAIGAFLLWCISYAIQLQKESTAKKKSRDDLLQQKEELLDQIADLEERRESNAVESTQYRREMKDLRHKLSRVLDSLGHQESQKSAKRGT